MASPKKVKISKANLQSPRRWSFFGSSRTRETRRRRRDPVITECAAGEEKGFLLPSNRLRLPTTTTTSSSSLIRFVLICVSIEERDNGTSWNARSSLPLPGAHAGGLFTRNYSRRRSDADRSGGFLILSHSPFGLLLLLLLIYDTLWHSLATFFSLRLSSILLLLFVTDD